MIIGVYIIAQLTYRLNPSHNSPVVSKHNQNEHRSQIMDKLLVCTLNIVANKTYGLRESKSGPTGYVSKRAWVSDYDHFCVHYITTYNLSESESLSISCV